MQLMCLQQHSQMPYPRQQARLLHPLQLGQRMLANNQPNNIMLNEELDATS